MNEHQADELLKRYKEELAVDEEFKKNLRKTFEKRRNRPRGFWKLSIWGMAASFLLVLYSLFDASVSHVNASALKIWGQRSFADVGYGQTVSMAERNGTLYLSLANQGIFEYGKDSFKKIAEENVNTFSWNPAGDQILFSAGGNIGILDVHSGKSQTIRQGERGEVYSHPAWMGNDAIFFEKQAGSDQDSLIVQMDLSSRKETTIGPGKKPSYLMKDKALIFERDQKIFFKDLKNKQERQVDEGFDPAVSADGEYVAYVKKDAAMENVWISDIQNGTQKQITANLENTNPELDIELGKAIYRFTKPIWSTDSNHVYVLKQRKEAGSQVTRIDLTKNNLTAQETIAKYMQALMSREEDFAKSLMTAPPAEPLTWSNPRVSGYHLLSSGTENGRTYVDAQAYWSYTANPYYQIVESRYFLTPGENGFRISSIQQRAKIEVTYLNEGEQVKLITNDTEQVLFAKNDIPSDLLDQGGHFRIASLAFDQPTHKVYFTLQYMKEETGDSHSYVTLLVYDGKLRQFAKLQEIREWDGKKDVGVSLVTVDPSGQFVSLDLYQDHSNEFKSITYVYDTRTNESLDLRNALQNTEISNMYAQYWEDGKMTFQVVSSGQLLLFEYDPKK